MLFEDKQCLIRDASGKDLFNVKMKGKNFALNPIEKVQTTLYPELVPLRFGTKDLALLSSRFASDAVKEVGRRTR